MPAGEHRNVLDIAGRSGDGRLDDSFAPKASILERRDNSIYGSSSDFGVTYDSSLANTFSSSFELRFDEENPRCVVRTEFCELLADGSKGDERQVRNDDVKRVSEHGWVDRPDIRTLDDIDPLVLTDTPMHLAVPNVHRAHRDRTALQKTVGETTSGCADVDRPETGWIDVERRQRGVELPARSADKRLWRADDVHRLVWCHHGCRLWRRVRADTHEACVNGALRFGATLDEFAPDKLGVESATGQEEVSTAASPVPDV